MQFKVTFEATGFTNSGELVGQECTAQEAKGFTEVSLAEATFPKSVLAVLGGRIAEDDEQGDEDIHVFVCVDLLVEANSEEAVESFVPPEDLLTKISDLMSSGFDLDLEAHSWEVTEVEDISEELTSAFQSRIDQLPILSKGAGPAYTLAVVAQDAIAAAGGDASKVDWLQVDRTVIETAMRTNQQPAQRVREVLQANSPGTITAEGLQAMGEAVARVEQGKGADVSKRILFSNIEWETDGHTVPSLPISTELEVGIGTDVDLEGADALSEQFGYCVQSFNWSEAKKLNNSGPSGP